MGGFKIEDDFDESWADIRKYVGSIQSKIEDEKTIKLCLKDIGKLIQKYVKLYAPKRSEHPSYSDAGRSEYKHVIDDIKYNVKKSKASGQFYVSIHGGKWTGYKWKWINDGHFTDGAHPTWVEGTHFMDKAEKASADGVDEIVEKYLKEALDDK